LKTTGVYDTFPSIEKEVVTVIHSAGSVLGLDGKHSTGEPSPRTLLKGVRGVPSGRRPADSFVAITYGGKEPVPGSDYLEQ
jgi:hypothetical protein